MGASQGDGMLPRKNTVMALGFIEFRGLGFECAV